MKPTRCSLTFVLIGIILGGCCDPVMQHGTPAAEITSQIQPPPKILDLYSDLAIQNAIITQRTIYPYHFAANSAALNTLGQRDLEILIAHFVRYPGDLAVRRGSEDKELYEARLTTISSLLAESGIALDKVRITDGTPGGNGISTSDLIDALARSREPFSDDNGGYTPIFTTQP